MEMRMKGRFILGMNLFHSLIGMEDCTLNFDKIAKILSGEVHQLTASCAHGDIIDSDVLNLRKIELALMLCAVSDHVDDLVPAKRLCEDVIAQGSGGELEGIARNNLAALLFEEAIAEGAREKLDDVENLLRKNLDLPLSENIHSRARLGLEHIEHARKKQIKSMSFQLIYIIPESLNRFSNLHD
ncbi:MAG: hypothetical protein US13_C0015G0020 [candidate division TM6 bacterium GW2011_GWE2_36_25]|nr:MAG: hypothetical protein US03_C0014G0020 [candidate division TM6 bacterium GW2011_GWF2_36_131]KKQ02536.1 MAG: hypothetical protein US13_C0015G0020 [candidate division TM6 bacterium GW2011_GWE2_36_25]KKQ19282.1 MAG: hypothetical protein US32_C0012G0020 [candidate division TM6 bacterium GW2011_GWA2_36_9]